MDQWLGLGIFLLGAGIGALITHIAELRHCPGLSNEARPAMVIGGSPEEAQSEVRSCLQKEEAGIEAAIPGGTSPVKAGCLTTPSHPRANDQDSCIF